MWLSFSQSLAGMCPPAIPSNNLVDLTGYWSARVVHKGRSFHIREKFVQIGNEVEGSDFGPNDTWRTGVLTYKGCLAFGVVVGQSWEASSAPKNPHWAWENLYLDGPNKMRFQLSPLVLVRDDVPSTCTPTASKRVDPEIDYDKARSALLKNQDFKEGACWFRAAAEQGNARSAAIFAVLLYTGNGVVPDRAEALEWAKKSASLNDPLGQTLVSSMTERQQPATATVWEPSTGIITWDQVAAALNRTTPSALTMRDAIIASLSTWDAAGRRTYDKLKGLCQGGGTRDFCVQASNMREFGKDYEGPELR
jgi:hypothetical protein